MRFGDLFRAGFVRPLKERKGASACILLFSLLAMFVPAASRGQALTIPAPPTTAEALDGLDEYVAAVMRQWRAPGVAISIVKDGHVVLSKGYGVRDLTTGAPMRSDTLFPTQSLTKAFTAFTAGLLVDEGTLNLDEPISTYIPGFRMHDPIATLEVTIRDFLAHRSGLPAHGWVWLTNAQLTREEAMHRMPYLPLVEPFRTRWRYANLGYVATAHAVENVAGVPWERFAEERIFQPLGMTRTTFSRGEAVADSNHAGGSMWRDGRDVATPLQSTTPLTNSTGGIISTADDMAKWMLVQLGEGSYAGKQIIQAARLAEMHTPQMLTNRPLPPGDLHSLGYGLGWYIESYRGEKMIEHGGNHWGVSSATGLLPDRELGVTVYVNQDGDLAVYLMLSIFDRFIGGEQRDWPAKAVAQKNAAETDQVVRESRRQEGRVTAAPYTHSLSDYAGTYVHPGYGKITVVLRGNELVAHVSDDVSALAHWHYDVFVPTASAFGNIWAMLEGLRIQFLHDFDGKVDGLRLTATVDGAVFTKQPEQIPAPAG